MRPLQLPSCIRRLFGATIAEAVGPTFEAGLSAGQAAIRGGTCGPNVRCAYEHLASAPARPQDPRWDLAHLVFGDLTEGIRSFVEGIDEGHLAVMAALVFVDQSKAFERIGHVWLAMVLAG